MVSTRDQEVTGMQEAGRRGASEQWLRASRDQEVWAGKSAIVHKDV